MTWRAAGVQRADHNAEMRLKTWLLLYRYGVNTTREGAYDAIAPRPRFQRTRPRLRRGLAWAGLTPAHEELVVFTQGKAAVKLVLRMAAKAAALFRGARPSSSLIDYSRRKGRTWPHRDRDGAWRGRVRLRHQPQRRSVVRTVKHFPSNPVGLN